MGPVAEAVMSSSKKILKNSFVYSAGVFFDGICSAVLGLAVARWLGPSVQGIWQTARLFRAYSDMTTLGQALGMRREVAVAMGAGKEDEVAAQRDTAFTWNTGTMALAGTAIALYALLFPHPALLRQSLLAVAITVALAGASSFFNLWYKTIGRFGVLASSSVASGMISLLAVPLVYRYRFTGLITSYVLTSVVILAAMVAAYREPVRFRFSLAAWLRSSAVGFPLFLISASGLLFSSIDRILVIGLMGFSDMGFYSISTMCFMPIDTVLSSVSVVLLPRVCQKFGRDASFEGLSQYYLLPLSILMIGLPSAAGLIALVLRPVVLWLLPQYEAGILPAQIAMIGLSFSAAAGFCHNILLAARKTWWLVYATSAGSIAKLALVWALIRCGLGLAGVSAAAAMAYALQFVLVFWMTASLTRAPMRQRGAVMAEAFVSVVLCAVLCWYVRDLGWVLHPQMGLSFVLRLAASACLAAPMLIASFRLWRML